MEEDNIEKIPNAATKLADQVTNDDKFLFFFKPSTLADKCVFDISLETGVRIAGGIVGIEALGLLFNSFDHTRWLWTIIDIICALLLGCTSFYTIYSTINKNYKFAYFGYLVFSVIMIYYLLEYVAKSILKLIKFINPISGDFLNLKLLVYVLGRGAILFCMLYFVYIIFSYMKTLK